MPAFVHYPKKVKRGSRSDAMGTVMDLLPTFLALAGTKHPGTMFQGREVLPPRGVSLVPLLFGKASSVHSSDEILGLELFGYRSVRQGDWKLVWDQAAPAEQRRWSLFNLKDDISEQHDLSDTNPEKHAQLQQGWDRYAMENGVVY